MFKPDTMTIRPVTRGEFDPLVIDRLRLTNIDLEMAADYAAIDAAEAEKEKAMHIEDNGGPVANARKRAYETSEETMLHILSSVGDGRIEHVAEQLKTDKGFISATKYLRDELGVSLNQAIFLVLLIERWNQI